MTETFPDPKIDEPLAAERGSDASAVLAGGCFWCVEAVYLQLDGVKAVVSGYAGGTSDTANYETVCSGTTNHAEAVLVRYDPSAMTFGQLLKVFFYVAHDPTQLNRQGADHGRQYRSAIFYRNARQKEIAEAYIRQLDAAGVFPSRIVTTLEPLDQFYEAEAHHQNYAARNPAQPYIAYVAAPKVAKLRATLPGHLRKGEQVR
jgi:peptide-methionine (S)-S-oxide reductase